MEQAQVYDLLITGGRAVTPQGTILSDILVLGEKIVRLAPGIKASCRRRVDASGLTILPGLVDPHVHLALPMKGTQSSDDSDSGTAAALFGGVTTILDFTRQRRGQSLAESLTERRAEFAGRAHCDYAFHVNVTDFAKVSGRDAAARDRGWALIREDLRELRALGAKSLKIFTCYAREGMAFPMGDLAEFLRITRAEGFQVLVHAEDDELVESSLRQLVAQGRTGAEWYARSRPPEAEAKAVHEVAEVAASAGIPIYFVHVSTAGGVGAIRSARERFTSPVYLETCPQYLLLEDSVYAGPEGLQYTVAPTLRKPADQAALLEALVSGAVDTVGTDHCSFRKAQKTAAGPGFLTAPNGLPGLETRLSLLYTVGVVGGRMSMVDLVRVAATRPAEIFGLAPRKGSIVEGADADLVLFDPAEEWTITPGNLHMNTDFSPYAGLPVRGRVRTVVLRGETVLDAGRLLVRGRGQDLRAVTDAAY